MALALARRPQLVAFARALVPPCGRANRLARVTAAYTFVGHLVDGAHGCARGGLRLLLDALGAERGPAVVLAALLLALGERARLECTRERVFVRVEVGPWDAAALPPHARVEARGGRVYLALDPRRRGSPLGFLEPDLREVLARRRDGAVWRPAWKRLRVAV